ncbi:dihydrodipicolinate synthase family protein [Pedobacter immunditicola]|uniref:dihydrodipicolinate synthase family protein n=1 Tax=Pedobacter immunditicola TaxID=3133440 RepID=UPI0030A5A429
MEKKFSGVVVPMITPFTKQFQVDTNAVVNIAEHLINHNTHPFVLGTTGESVSISKQERLKLVKATVAATAGRKTVYAGISGNCFSEVIEEAKAFADLGVNAFVSTMPCYYPVDPDQMLRYFEALADAVSLPLIIYNIPSTTHLSIPLAIADKLSYHDNIMGFKDSEKGIDRVVNAIALWKNRPDFSYLLGWALMSQKAMALGADGIVPSTGNLSPGLYQTIFEAGKAGNEKLALNAQIKADFISEIYQKDKILSRSLPVLKTMMSAFQLCETTVLPPLHPLEHQQAESVVNEVLMTFGNLNSINNIENES